jgi:hypothetical protein
MLKNLARAYGAHGKKVPHFLSPVQISPSHASQHYCTEAIDYVHGIQGGKIQGVPSSLVDECPVCTKILRELYGDDMESMHVDVSVAAATAASVASADAATKLWVGMWLLHRDERTEDHKNEAKM